MAAAPLVVVERFVGGARCDSPSLEPRRRMTTNETNARKRRRILLIQNCHFDEGQCNLVFLPPLFTTFPVKKTTPRECVPSKEKVHRTQTLFAKSRTRNTNSTRNSRK